MLAGFLIGTSYIPFPPWALFFCLAPLFYFWLEVAKSTKQAFIGGWLTQFILTLIGFHWISYTATEFGHFPWWGGILTVNGFAATAYLHYAVSGALVFYLFHAKRFTRTQSLHPALQVFTYAAAFALCELLLPAIFPWHLGYPWLWAQWPGAQLADVIGFEGLNIATIAINAMNALVALAIISAIRFRKKNRASSFARTMRAALLPAGAAVGAIAALNLIGLGRSDVWKKTDASIKVLAVQGNIGNFDKLMAERGAGFRIPIVQKYLELTRRGMLTHSDAQLVIWPETAFPDRLDRAFADFGNAELVRALSRNLRRPILTGGYSQDLGQSAVYNGLFYINGHGEVGPSAYRKTILLAFGETFPLSDYIPYMQKLLPDMGSFSQGSGPIILPVEYPFSADSAPTASFEQVKIGPQICYEGLYPWFSAGLSKAGAEVFINVTNDSWFGLDFEPFQHLYMTAARAVEFRRPLMRSTNTGITTAVLATGEFRRLGPIHEEWVDEFDIPYRKNPPHTVYEKINGCWGWVLAIALSFLVLFGRKKPDSAEARSK